MVRKTGSTFSMFRKNEAIARIDSVSIYLMHFGHSPENL
jgi:hypothetical protein